MAFVSVNKNTKKKDLAKIITHILLRVHVVRLEKNLNSSLSFVIFFLPWPLLAVLEDDLPGPLPIEQVSFTSICPNSWTERFGGCIEYNVQLTLVTSILKCYPVRNQKVNWLHV